MQPVEYLKQFADSLEGLHTDSVTGDVITIRFSREDILRLRESLRAVIYNPGIPNLTKTPWPGPNSFTLRKP